MQERHSPAFTICIPSNIWAEFCKKGSWNTGIQLEKDFLLASAYNFGVIGAMSNHPTGRFLPVGWTLGRSIVKLHCKIVKLQ